MRNYAAQNKMSKDPAKGRGILRRTANLIEQTSAAQLHLVHPDDPTIFPVDIEIEFTSDLPIGSTSTDTAAQTYKLAYAIYV